MGPPSRPSLSGVVTRLKCDTRKGVERQRKSEGERERWDSSRRDEQVSAEKWVSRTGVSAGEYHIATLWRSYASRDDVYECTYTCVHVRT